MPIVLLIRHAQASFGAADYDVLSESGHAQVEALHRALTRRGVVADRVVTGSLLASATPAARGRGGAGPAGAHRRALERVRQRRRAVASLVDRGAPGAGPSDTGPALSSRDFQVVFDQGLQEWVDAGADSPARQSWPGFLAEINGCAR